MKLVLPRIFRRADRKVKPAWQFKTTGDLWRILFSDSGRVVGEDRDPAAKTVTFFCLDETTGEVIWSGIKLEERWWIGMEAIFNGIVYLHEYVKPNLPQHQKIIALDLPTGKLLWRNDELRFLSISEGRLYASKDFFERRLYFELNLATGEVGREFTDEEGAHLKRGEEDVILWDIVFPSVFEVGAGNYDKLAQVIRSHCDLRKVAGTIEFIQRENLLFFNYHERTTPATAEARLLKNCLKVVNTDRNRLIFSDVLNEKALAPTPDSFFLKGEQLFFIRNKNTLVAIRLEELYQKA
jgi:hypothetical protein